MKNTIIGGLIGGLFTLLILRCTTVPKVVEIRPVASNNTTTCKSGEWCYDDFIQTNALVSSTMLSADFGDLCRSYNNLDRQVVWTKLIQAISFAESDWNPTNVYEENFIDSVTGKNALSVGMLQLSIGDRANYKTPYCTKMDEAGLKDPLINIGCGTEIMNVLIARNRSIENLGRYWSVMRKTNDRYPVMKAKFLELIPECSK